MLGQVQVDSEWQIDTEGKGILLLSILSTEIIQAHWKPENTQNTFCLLVTLTGDSFHPRIDSLQ